MRLGRDVPAEYLPPELNSVEMFYWAAFWELSTDRQIGMTGSGPIPYTSLNEYTKGYNELEAKIFRDTIRALDGVYLKEKPVASEPLTRNKLRGD